MAEQAAFKLLGETIGVWFQSAAFALSAIYAGLQVKALKKQTAQNERQTKRRATVDVVLHEKQDGVLVEARKKYGEMRESGINFTAFACQKLTENKDENSAILALLNNYEFMAVGIREGAFDEDIYKRMKKTLVVRDWGVLNGYVIETRRRNNHPKLFVEFEWLADKWSKE